MWNAMVAWCWLALRILIKLKYTGWWNMCWKLCAYYCLAKCFEKWLWNNGILSGILKIWMFVIVLCRLKDIELYCGKTHLNSVTQWTRMLVMQTMWLRDCAWKTLRNMLIICDARRSLPKRFYYAIRFFVCKYLILPLKKWRWITVRYICPACRWNWMERKVLWGEFLAVHY